MSAIESPCILVCSIDRATGYCFGCGRTQPEIGAWLDMTPETPRNPTRAHGARTRLPCMNRLP